MFGCLGLTLMTTWDLPYSKPSKASSEKSSKLTQMTTWDPLSSTTSKAFNEKSSKLQTYIDTWAPPSFEAFSEKAVFEINMLPVSCPVSFKSKSKTNNGLYISGTGFGYHQNATHTFAEIARDEE